MAVITPQDQASSLLSRNIAEARIRGAMAPDIEATAIFESVTLALLVKPRAVLLFALLAKNGLRKVVQDELDLVAEILAAIKDLNNTQLSIRSAQDLNKARTSLLGIEQLDKISAANHLFKK